MLVNFLKSLKIMVYFRNEMNVNDILVYLEDNKIFLK